MASLISFPIHVFYGNKMPLFVPGATNSHNPPPVNGKNKCQITLLNKSLITGRGKSFGSRQRSLLFNAKCSESEAAGEEDNNNPALETVLKLYTAIKNKNINEVSNTIGDECRCICNFFSFFQFFQGKEQVLKFFNHVMEILGKNFEFVVQPTLQDGMNVGVSWKLEWCKTHMPLGKGFSFYICQKYQGKVLIRNVEMFMEPILHIEPFRMKLMAYLMCMTEICSGNLPKEKVKKAILALILLAIILIFLKPGLH